ncbi:MAG: invasin domain 3-containing protein, partial [Hafnia sp.]
GGSSFAVSAASVTLTADATTAGLDNPGSVLSVEENGAIANGTDTNSVKAIVTDVNGNPVAGETVTFGATNSASVTASAITGTDGSASAIITNLIAGTSEVTATVNGDSITKDVNFVAGALADSNSTLSANPTSIAADGVTTTTLSWKAADANDNPISGMTSVGFSVGAATGVTIDSVTESSEGTYTAVLSGLKAQIITISPTIDGTVTGTNTATVTLVPPLPVALPVSSRMGVNGTTFTTTQGFPSTGFAGATFQVQIEGNTANNSNYDWAVDRSWVSVDSSGNVTFSGEASSTTKMVTITATPKAGGVPYSYSFTLGNWFIFDSELLIKSDAISWCATLPGGYTLAPFHLATHGQFTRNIGSLWSEWGNAEAYNWPLDWGYWVDGGVLKDTYFPSIGSSQNTDDDRGLHTLCSRNL